METLVAVYNSNGELLVSYSYDAWGNFEITTEEGHENEASLFFAYRGYYYDSDLGFYYLNSRYYDPITCRFLNADCYVSTGQGLTGNNMFAYCGNNPVMRVDPVGSMWQFVPMQSLMLSKYEGKTACYGMSSYAPSNTGYKGGYSRGDNSSSIGNIIGISTVLLLKSFFDKLTKSDTKVETNENDENQAYFTANPFDFNPKGLLRKEYPGGKNGRIIKWSDPITKIAIFEWDEDWEQGAHYHILNNGKHTGDHIEPNTKVPEPWNSIYFK